MSTVSPGRTRNSELTCAICSWPNTPGGVVHNAEDIKQYYNFMIHGYDKPFGYMHKSFVDSMEWRTTPSRSSSRKRPDDASSSATDGTLTEPGILPGRE